VAGADLRSPNVVTGHSHVWRSRGFTMVELIVVMVLMGILGAVGAARFFNRTAYDADAFTEQTRAMLRYAQKVAIAQNRPVYARMDGGSGIALCFENLPACPTASQVLAPAGSNSGSAGTKAKCGSASWYCEARPSGVTFALPLGTSYIYFDALGRPYNDAGALNAAGLAINISGDGIGRLVRVAQETGYVE
jgi:MSHA pilin protein MshC